MLIDEDTAIIFDVYYRNGVLSDENLTSAGFSIYKIKIFIKSGILEDQNGIYKIVRKKLYEKYAKLRGESEKTSLEPVVALEDTFKKNENGCQEDKMIAERFINKDNFNVSMFIEAGIIKKVPSRWGVYSVVNTEKFNLFVIFTIYLKHNTLNQKLLNEAGFVDKHIKKLVNTEVLAQVGEEYRIVNIPEFYTYGSYLEKQGNQLSAQKCYELCSKQDTNRTMIRALLTDILLENYSLAIERLLILIHSLDPTICADFNFYLYILSFLTDLPKDLNMLTKNITLEDVLVPTLETKSSLDVNKTNEVRTLAFKQQFANAAKRIENETKIIEMSGEEVILRRLLQQIYKDQNVFKLELAKAIEERRIIKTRNLIKKEASRHRVPKNIRYFYLICEDIISMRNTYVRVEPTMPVDDSLCSLIRAKQYEKALSKCLETAAATQTPPEKNHLRILLKIAVDAIKECNVQMSEHLECILLNLQENNIEVAKRLIKNYLSIYKMEQYSYLIDNLIDISLSLQDTSFEDPMKTLLALNASYVVDIAKYIEMIKKCIEAHNVEAANLYLKLVDEVVRRKHTDVTMEEVESLLKSLRSELNKKPELD